MEGVRLPLHQIIVCFFYTKQTLISYPSIPLDTFRWVGRSFIVHNKTNGTSLVLLSLFWPSEISCPKQTPACWLLFLDLLLHPNVGTWWYLHQQQPRDGVIIVTNLKNRRRCKKWIKLIRMDNYEFDDSSDSWGRDKGESVKLQSKRDTFY